VARIAGVAVGMPSAYYLAAIAAVLGAGADTASKVGALLLFNIVAFSLAEIPIVSFWLAPDRTRAFVDRLYEWMTDHHRLIVAGVAGVVGVYLIWIGVSKL
jgi:Sap, sulfolipid-1-addressing protein